MWLTGYPGIFVEKPILTPYNLKNLRNLQDSKNWYGEIKLNVKRGFITIDYKKDITFYKYLTNFPIKNLEEPISRLKNMELPPKTILDAGLYIDRVEKKPRFFIWDILFYANKELQTTCLQRRKLLETLIKTDDLIWRPVYTDFWLKEYDLMLKNNSCLVKRAALNYGIPYENLLSDVEGLVLKNKRSVLKYPKTQTLFSNSFLKLKLDTCRDYCNYYK